MTSKDWGLAKIFAPKELAQFLGNLSDALASEDLPGSTRARIIEAATPVVTAKLLEGK